METLIETQKAAYAAWVACPDRRKAEKAALEAALATASKAVAAAKRAAAPVVAVDADAVDAALARQKANAGQQMLASRIRAARARFAKAQEWPRCGQGWGESAQDKADISVLAKYGQDDCAWEDCA